ncbi:acyltransferase domain-containing protein [Aquimarina sp. I32.4]|uniref:acyltransferase domain-containing protein n=1 Tax=Aquimarina sp. I32.4 TaxID=2053903 RepID=UPI000CDF1819|nr:acyltransferase domain-containing protein [Aquimarina sp. I32.4]
MIDTNIKKHKIVFLFSGQGSQYIGMGRKLFENNKVFRTSLEKGDKIIQQKLDRSLINELYFTNHKSFDDVLITHPAIVAVEIAMYQVLKELGIKADYVSGISLGEFSAGVVSGIWDYETALEASVEQAKSIVRNNVHGGMLTIINENKVNLERIYLFHGLFLAGDNFEGHFTLSGTVENLDAFQLELIKLNIQFLRLPICIPFHSPLVLVGLRDFNYYMNFIRLCKPKPGFISGIKSKELDSDVPNNYFGEVVSQYTNYSKIVEYIENKASCLYIDLGPSGSNSTFVKNNLNSLSKSKTFQIMTPFGREIEQLEKLEKIFK